MARHNYYTDCHKGKYTLIHPEKYMPNHPAPYYKSDWERKFFFVCDMNPNITFWAYEPKIFEIPYMSPKYGRVSIYHPDIYLECNLEGQPRKSRWLIEVKPTSYSIQPKMPQPPKPGSDSKAFEKYQKRKANYDQKVMDVIVNLAKWEAAAEWCKRHGVNWFIANEKNTGKLFDSSTIIKM
jgi:hypothetical protein